MASPVIDNNIGILTGSSHNFQQVKTERMRHVKRGLNAYGNIKRRLDAYGKVKRRLTADVNFKRRLLTYGYVKRRLNAYGNVKRRLNAYGKVKRRLNAYGASVQSGQAFDVCCISVWALLPTVVECSTSISGRCMAWFKFIVADSPSQKDSLLKSS